MGNKVIIICTSHIFICALLGEGGMCHSMTVLDSIDLEKWPVII